MLILNKPNNREEEMKKEKMMKHFGDFMMFILLINIASLLKNIYPFPGIKKRAILSRL